MAILKSLIGIVLTGLLLASPGVAAPLVLHRGIGVHDWLNWAPLAADGTYRQPPFHTTQEWLSGYRPLASWPQGDEFTRIRAFGFDFVRLSVDPGPLLASSGAGRQAVLATLRTAIEHLTAAGLNVVFNLHPVTQVAIYSPDGIEQAPNSAQIAGYTAMLADVAAMLAAIGPAKVAIEPYNEPGYYPCDGGSRDWQAIQAAQVKAIRAVSQDLTIVATGACGGDIAGLVDLDAKAFDDANMLYSFHMYDPHDFTHQRLEDGWFSGLPWPADRLTRQQAEADLTTRMDAAGLNIVQQQANWLRLGGEIAAYFATGWDQAAMAAQFAQAATWAKNNDIAPERLFMGEFGVITMDAKGDSGATVQDRNRYLQTARQLAEGYGMAWAYWEYANPYGMTFIQPDGPSAIADPNLLAPLGLPR